MILFSIKACPHNKINLELCHIVSGILLPIAINSIAALYQSTAKCYLFSVYFVLYRLKKRAMMAISQAQLVPSDTRTHLIIFLASLIICNWMHSNISTVFSFETPTFQKNLCNARLNEPLTSFNMLCL